MTEKVVLITGTSRGIGNAIAAYLCCNTAKGEEPRKDKPTNDNGENHSAQLYRITQTAMPNHRHIDHDSEFLFIQ